MCRTHQRVDMIGIWLDASGQVGAVNVIHHHGTDHERIDVLEVGPFDTVKDVLEAAMRRLDIQLTLW